MTTPANQPADVPMPTEWLAFVQQRAAEWDGVEETWGLFAQMFRLYALDVDLEDEADALVADLDGLTNGERILILTTRYGVTLAPQPARRLVDQPVAPPAAQPRKRERENDVQQQGPPKRQRSERLAPSGADLGPGTLEVTWRRTGATIQKLNADQAMGFHQVATLSRPDGSTKKVEALYAFYQEVCDAYTEHGGKPTKMGPFEQDKTFKPPYGGESTQRSDGQIVFTDDPGWSGTTLIFAGQWLTSYTVSFRWRVVNRHTQKEWVSPTLTYTLTCPYAGGADAPIDATPRGQQTWQITFP